MRSSVKHCNGQARYHVYDIVVIKDTTVKHTTSMCWGVTLRQRSSGPDHEERLLQSNDSTTLISAVFCSLDLDFVWKDSSVEVNNAIPPWTRVTRHTLRQITTASSWLSYLHNNKMAIQRNNFIYFKLGDK